MQNALANTRILISGAGVAGPALACCLQRYGAKVTIVEVSPALRPGGFAVDFRGPTQQRILSELGVLEALQSKRTTGSAVRCVDAAGRERFCLPAEFMGGELEVYRGDLSCVLYEHSADAVEYWFGERIVSLRQTADHVEVELMHAGTQRFDLVIGADGMRSNVRRLAFAPEHADARHLGYYFAGWGLANRFGATNAMDHYAEPGRSANITVDQRDRGRAIAYFMFASPELEIDWRDPSAQKALIKKAFAGMPWQASALLGTLDAAEDLYFDAISRVQMPRFSEGRVALLGDSAWGATFGGVGPALVGAYVLAGELAAASGDPGRALAGYEKLMRPYTATWLNDAHAGTFMAPRTARGLWLRNTLLSMRPVQWLMLKSQKLSTELELPHYDALTGTVA